MTQRGFPEYWWGQRGKPTADLIKHRSSVDTETDGASLAARPSRQTVIDTLNNKAHEPIFIVDFGEELLICWSSREHQKALKGGFHHEFRTDEESKTGVGASSQRA